MSEATRADVGEAAILSRLIRPELADLSPEAAGSLLKLGFDDQARARMHELAAKAQDGTLTGAEEDELDSYHRVGRILDLMHLKARRSLAGTISGGEVARQAPSLLGLFADEPDLVDEVCAMAMNARRCPLR